MKPTTAAAFLSLVLVRSAASHADTFGSGLNVFNIEFVPIGNPGNSADTTGDPNPAGSVPYEYRMSKYEVSEQMIDKANVLGGLGITKDTRGADKPATSVSWFQAAKFVNWLNMSTGHSPAYKFDSGGNFQLWQAGDPGHDPNNLYRNRRAKYVLPSVDEWYKAAYYDPGAGAYHDYPTGSSTVPDGIDFVGDPVFDAVFYDVTSNPQPNDITNVGILSPYGTAGQGGNVYEWEETDWDLVNDSNLSIRGMRGGNWSTASVALWSSRRSSLGPASWSPHVGIRVASVTPEPQPLTVSGLRNFDSVSPPGIEVNDFHITLHGISDPLLAAQGGTQIQSTFPQSFNSVSGAPAGWYPPSVSLSGNSTVISYGGPGAQFVGSNVRLHFGVTLTPNGESVLDAICMKWTVDGVPVIAGGDANLPITVIVDQPAPGETKIQIVNQECPDGTVVGPGRWFGPVFARILDRHAQLDELTAGSPIMFGADIILDGHTFLPSSEQITLSDVDSRSPVAAGKSIVVWYDVFEDDGGVPGRFIGTSYSAFNVSAVPEPSSMAMIGMMAIAFAGLVRRCRHTPMNSQSLLTPLHGA